MGLAFSGKDGSVTFAAGYVLHTRSWSLDIIADALESTEFGEESRTYIVGLKGWSGAFEAFMDDTTKISGYGLAPADAVFLALTGMTFEGKIIVTGMHPSVSVDGISAVTFDVQGSGALEINQPV